MKNGNKIIILDRDGVINKSLGKRVYARTWDDIALLPGVLEGLKRLADHDYAFVVVSNQMGIGLGSVTKDEVDAVHDRMKQEFKKEGVAFLGFYVCPHRMEEDCACRKPNPGLILQAARDLGFDPAASFIIGDSPNDLLAGVRAGCPNGILVQTGYIAPDEEMKLVQPLFVAKNFVEAADFILRRTIPHS